MRIKYMVNFFYSTDILNSFIVLLEHNLKDFIRTIYKGDFTKLPLEDDLSDILPCIIITPLSTQPDWLDTEHGVIHTSYFYKLYYIYPYSNKYVEDEVVEVMLITERIANILIESNRLGLSIPQTETEQGGVINSVDIVSISGSGSDSSFFSIMGVEVVMSNIDIEVEFTTYRRKEWKNG